MSQDLIRISPEQVRQAATQFKSKSEESRQMMTQLTATWQRVRDVWAGSTANDVDMKMAEWKKQMQSHVELLAHVGNRLNELAKEFEDFDRQKRTL